MRFLCMIGLHKYSKWKKCWEYSMFQERECEKCGKLAQRMI